MHNLFKNHFESGRITDDELKKFAEHHLARISANNPNGVLTPRLSPTMNADNHYFGSISAQDVAEAVKQGLTKRLMTSFRNSTPWCAAKHCP